MPFDLIHGDKSPSLAYDSSWEPQVQRFVDKAVFYANETRALPDIHEAWRTFRVWLTTWIDYTSHDWRLFLVWYVFHWRAPGIEGEPSGPSDSIAEMYVRERPEEISEDERKIVAVAVNSPMDFYEIHEIPGLGSYYFKSLFLGYEQSYAFERLPSGLNVGDIFFGKIIQFREDRGVIAGQSRPFSRAAKVPVAHLRRQLIGWRKEEFMKNFSLFEIDLFNLYQDLLNKEA